MQNTLHTLSNEYPAWPCITTIIEPNHFRKLSNWSINKILADLFPARYHTEILQMLRGISVD